MKSPNNWEDSDPTGHLLSLKETENLSPQITKVVAKTIWLLSYSQKQGPVAEGSRYTAH